MFFVAMGHVHNRHGAYQAGFHDGRHYEHDARAIRHYHSLAAEAHAERGYWEAERRCIVSLHLQSVRDPLRMLPSS